MTVRQTRDGLKSCATFVVMALAGMLAFAASVAGSLKGWW
jgi:hypothetical protein